MSEPIFTAPWYPWYADDILLSERVELMNLAEEGAYRRALDRAWIKGSVPADPKMCARTIGKGCSTKIAEVVLTMFVPMPTDPTRMIQERLEVVREEQRQKYLKQSKKGKSGAEKRWQGHSTGISQAMPSDSHSESDTDFKTKEVCVAGESFGSLCIEGIKTELNLLQIPKESDWLIALETAEKNQFTVEHVLETFRLMRSQPWRTGPIKPDVLIENLPNLQKLRDEKQTNGTNRPKSEREKSASRTINANRMANDLISGNATVESIFGMDDESHIKGYLPS